MLTLDVVRCCNVAPQKTSKCGPEGLCNIIWNVSFSEGCKLNNENEERNKKKNFVDKCLSRLDCTSWGKQTETFRMPLRMEHNKSNNTIKNGNSCFDDYHRRHVMAYNLHEGVSLAWVRSVCSAKCKSHVA